MFISISGFENYSINEEGVVINNKTGRILKQTICQSRNSGYKRVFLYNANGRKTMSVHRLVAMTFIPNPNNYPQVSHKDENTMNNSVDNLEWCTAKYNCVYGHHTEKIQNSLKISGKSWKGRKHSDISKKRMSDAKRGKPSNHKKAVIVDGKTEIASLTECAIYLGISITQVYNAIKGIRKLPNHTINYKEVS